MVVMRKPLKPAAIKFPTRLSLTTGQRLESPRHPQPTPSPQDDRRTEFPTGEALAAFWRLRFAASATVCLAPRKP